MNPLPEFIDALGLANVWTYLVLFLVASLLILWRLDALLAQGLEGTALGTLVMPYCSGLGNLLFVGIMFAHHEPAREVLVNCLVNNVTNLTLVLGVPAIIWGLRLQGKTGAKKKGARKSADGDVNRQLNRLALLLTLAAVVFFSAVTWMLGNDGRLDRMDGLVLIALFLFWQCFQVFDVMKHNVRERRAFGAMFYVDVLLVLIGAYGSYVSIDWLVDWLSHRHTGVISAAHLGWLTGLLMVAPNAMLALYYAARQRADVAYASQVGDGHICIPLCIGLAAVFAPLQVPEFFQTGLILLCVAAVVHGTCVLTSNSLPRWMGWPLIAAYVWFTCVGWN